MNKFLKEVLTDGDGKFSSKRSIGIVSGIIGLAMAVLSGFQFYKIDVAVFQTILTFSGAMLGASVLRKGS